MFTRIFEERYRPEAMGGCMCDECTRAFYRALLRECFWWVFGLPANQMAERAGK